MSEYKVEVYSGCMGIYITVNDENIYDLDDDVLLDFQIALCTKVLDGLRNESIDLHDILKILQSTKYEFDKDNCGQCGHNGMTETWEI